MCSVLSGLLRAGDHNRPHALGLDAEAVDGSNTQQNRSVGGRGLRTRLFSTGARLWGTSAIAKAIDTGARLWGTSAIAKAIDRLSAGGARGMLSARLFSTFCLGPLSVAILDSTVIIEITQGVEVAVIRAASGPVRVRRWGAVPPALAADNDTGV